MFGMKTLAPARSTLEEMLESIKQKDEKPSDAPPALPRRPTSKARLPSAVRSRKQTDTIAPLASSHSETRTSLVKISNSNITSSCRVFDGDVARQSSKDGKTSSREDSEFVSLPSPHAQRWIDGNKIGVESPSCNADKPSIDEFRKEVESEHFGGRQVERLVAETSHGTAAESKPKMGNMVEYIEITNADVAGSLVSSGVSEEEIKRSNKEVDTVTNEVYLGERISSDELVGKVSLTSKVGIAAESNIDNCRCEYGQIAEHADFGALIGEESITDKAETNKLFLQNKENVAAELHDDSSSCDSEQAVNHVDFEALDVQRESADKLEDSKVSLPSEENVAAESHDDSPSCDYEQAVKHVHSTEDSPLENGSGLHSMSAKANIAHSKTFKKKRKDDGISGLKKNSRVWCLNSDNKWTLGFIHSATDSESIVRRADAQPQFGRGHDVSSKLLRIPSVKVLPANPDILEGVDDLIQLSYLNEPAVLHNLQYRYTQDKIYTKAGPVLIAVNPFKNVPLYTEKLIRSYRVKGKEKLRPHVYMAADSAFGAMLRDGVNQSIIISGESGAGKTETAKIAMQYLAALGGGGGIEDEILQTNPILEAFGNAKTLRNDNSSRFGKLIDIFFGNSGKICGAKIQTYLLEKSRVVHQANCERSYHIFYQLCAGADLSLKSHLNLRAATFYHYLNQSGCMHIDNVDDATRFSLTLNAMDVVQLSKEEQRSAFAMLAAVLWIGNICFALCDSESHVTVVDNEAITAAASLLKCNKEHLMRALSTRNIHAGHEDIVQKLTHSQAADSRDALAKAIYSSLFDWLVDRINKSLEAGKCQTGRLISILDIYGFESFEKNSFEQLCINYANERLQQFFNRHLFKLEQEEYGSEGIDWAKVEFEDNQECLNLIEKRPLGLIALFDEECTFPKGTDSTLADKLKKHLSGYACFKGERSKAFRIQHYAGEVVYDTSGFLEKNRDLLHSDLLQLLASCEAQLPRLFAANIDQDLRRVISSVRRNVAESQKQSVATKFKGQLFKLMQRLESTSPHFIRCIKPNKLQLPRIYHHDLVLQQLRCCGVLEVVRISRSGFPTRMLHQQFADRYGFLLPKGTPAQQEVLSVCVAVLQRFNIPPDMYQVGFTKLFFRAGQIGRLEDLRAQTLQGILGVQKCYRGYRIRNYVKELKKSVILFQSLVRVANARRHFAVLRKQHEAAVVIQKFARCRIAFRKFIRIQKTIILLQSVLRGWLGRREASFLLQQQQEREKTAMLLGQESEHCEQMAEPDAAFETFLAAASGSYNMDLPRQSDFELAETRSCLIAAEAALRAKDDENAILRKRLDQYESRWSEYETKMVSMEEMWGKQMTSLQLSLAAAKKSLAAEEPVSEIIKQNDFFNLQTNGSRQPATRSVLPHADDFDWDTSSGDTRMLDQSSTPSKLAPHHFDLSQETDLNAGRSIVSHLVKEYEHRTQVFEDDADFLVEVKSGQTQASLNPEEELQKLKERFESWAKDYKIRLRETKGILQKLSNIDSVEKSKKKWWVMRAS